MDSVTNLQIYISTFKSAFLVEESVLPDLVYQGIDAWDSVGHMALMAALEEAFKIEMEIDDIIEFSSFEAGKSILAKYGVALN
jgi:acyl carrier protein